MLWISRVVRYRRNYRHSRKYLGHRPILDTPAELLGIEMSTVTTQLSDGHVVPYTPWPTSERMPPHTFSAFLSRSVGYQSHLLGGLVVVFIHPRFPILSLPLLPFPPASYLSLPRVRNSSNSNCKPSAKNMAGKWLCSSTVKRFSQVFR